MLTQGLVAQEARRISDPNYVGAVEHIFTVKVTDLPQLPLGANPRQQNTNKRVYKDVAASLLNKDGTTTNSFLSKNLGIWACAEAVHKKTDAEFVIEFGEGDSILDGLDGIINGGHTAQIIWNNQDEIRERVAAGDDISQFVKLHVRVGYPRDVLADAAGALNTTLQVPDWSLAEHADKFDWIHKEIETKPYASAISFKENQPGEIFAPDVLAMLDLFNTAEHPNTGSKHPTQAYAFKSGVLERYLKDPAPFKALAPILDDILVLHDTIAMEGRDKYNEYFKNNKTGQSRGRGKDLEWVETRTRGKFKFPFIGKEGDVRLNRAAVYPAMAAFRWMVEDRGTTVQWKGGFDNVLDLWGRVGPELMKITQDTSVENARKTLAIGKSPTHYNALHSVVAKYQLMLTPSKQLKLAANS